MGTPDYDDAGIDPKLLIPSRTLTPRQREMVQLSADGLSYKEIADKLGVTPNTVDTTLTTARKKKQVGTTAGLVAAAFRDGEVK